MICKNVNLVKNSKDLTICRQIPNSIKIGQRPAPNS
jgi:hypothetical protein